MAVFLIGLSLFVVTVVRTNSVPRLMTFGNEEEGATSGWVLYSDFLMFDREFSVNIRTNNTVNVYILDDGAVKQWRIDKSVNAVWAYEDVVAGVFSEQSNGRGGYAVLVYLPEDSVTVIKVVLTFSGFEKDLLTLSSMMIGIGILSTTVLLIIEQKNKKT
ncbi:MAG: hypothetical protein LBC12_03215 [Nitrososphaerota archaeon]|nr:hypothetical protein [Nitrososphaerota archaeon]